MAPNKAMRGQVLTQHTGLPPRAGVTSTPRAVLPPRPRKTRP
jgi:hypothetical protein